jgi:hypothetical protein
MRRSASILMTVATATLVCTAPAAATAAPRLTVGTHCAGSSSDPVWDRLRAVGRDVLRSTQVAAGVSPRPILPGLFDLSGSGPIIIASRDWMQRSLDYEQ